MAYNLDDVTIDPGFRTDGSEPVIIKVVGVGGGGNNAINHMYTQDVKGVSFVVCNTDRQALMNSVVPNRLLIGPETCKGLGAGNNPEKACKAAEESADEIAQLFDDDTKMVFITAGMGGGTGTGAAPVVARIAREKGVLTIGIVTIPFLFEGNKKILKALAGADEMSKYVDAILIINNERLTEIYPELDVMTAFGKADDTLTTAARSISELITTNGKINLDFEDVNTTLREGGVAIISSGYGEGEHRVTKAIHDALKSPLLKNRDVYGSKKILVNVYFNPNSSKPFVMEEVGEINNFMCNFDLDLDVIWGTAFDETLGDKIKVTILASGFNLSLEAESNAQKKVAAKPNHTSSFTEEPTENAKPTDAGIDRITKEYGIGTVAQREQENARARYLILSDDDINNDEIINILESTPTFRRDPAFKDAIKMKQNSPSAQQDEDSDQEAPKATKSISFD